MTRAHRVGAPAAVPAPVSARAFGKVNLLLAVGARRSDGYHDLTSVFQSLNLAETITLTPAVEFEVRLSGRFADPTVPLDESNLALASIRALITAGAPEVPVLIEIEKNVPVAAGMGGGSADAAAALLAYKRLSGFTGGLDAVAAGLGADVPFALRAGTAVGTGRGDLLTPVMTRQRFHWVVATAGTGLSTPAVYRRLDELRAAGAAVDSAERTAARRDAVLEALAGGDPERLAGVLHNDMEPAALDLEPGIEPIMRAGRDAGALAALLSGSGPTVVFPVRDAHHALDLAVMLEATPGVARVLRTTGPAGPAGVLD
jgi:4-diphosphocytidyl-2-C-methyl-D-erythritol kinase